MYSLRVCALLVSVAAVGVLSAQAPSSPGSAPGVLSLALTSQDVSPLREWDGRLDRMLRDGEVALRTRRGDTVLADRTHERYDQYVRGVRVFGGDVARQTRAGVTQSLFGTLIEAGGLDTNPRLSEDEARARFAAMAAEGFPDDRPIELVVLPRDEGGYALAWRSHVWTSDGWMHTFLDAHTGGVVLQYNDLHRQAAVGTGTGVLGDRKKISTNAAGGRYWADDRLRPPLLVTYDMQGDWRKAYRYLNGLYRPALSDQASDADNAWTDPANVDAHVHLGWTYDYLFKRFNRRGLNDREAPIFALTHSVSRSNIEFLPNQVIDDFVLGAFWCSGCGPDRQGAMVFGEGLPPGYYLVRSGQYVDYLAGGLDVIAHELFHGLTAHSSGLVYRNESGALNESISDILGTSVEFFYQRSGDSAGQPDYLIAEDIYRPGGIRSMSNPAAFGDPDHYSRRYRGVEDHGGVHINSGIPNQAFFLSVEGGVNRTSGLRVNGVGAANREQIEKVFYRAFTYMLPSSATFRTARAATIQSARDQYGIGSPAERAVTEAWTAVGVF